MGVIPPTPTSASGGPSRRRLGRLTTGVLTLSALVLGTVATSTPVLADEASAPAEVATMPGKGTTDSDQIALSGQDVAAAAEGSATSRAAEDGAPKEPTPGETGWTQQIDLLPGTQMVALSWDGTTSGPDGPASGRMSLRSATGDGPWGEWMPIAPDPADQGGEGTGRVGSDIVWLGAEGADRVEVRIDAGPLVELELLRMRYHEGEPVPVEDAAGTAGRTAEGKAARPTIRPRSAWATRGWASGNSGCGSGPSVASRLQHVVIHHTASTNSYTQAQVPGLLDGIRAYHQSSLGWCDTAYNFIVDRFGGIWQGRDGDVTKAVIGGHAQGFNTGSTGVALLGQFQPGATPASGSPTSAMLDSTARFLAWKLDVHGLDPNGSTTVTSGGSSRYSSGTRVTLPIINPHLSTGYTACPGTNVTSQMGWLRSNAAAYMSGGGGGGGGGGGTVVTDWRPFDSVEALVYRQYVDFLRSPGTYAGRRWWHENLTNGATHRNALVASLLSNGQLQDQSASSVRLYLAYFGRIPDHSGLRFWWGEMDRGKGLRHVSAAFARSPEFIDRYGRLSDDQYVDLVYRNVLGRAPDPDGYAFWTGRLRAKQESRGGLMTLFSESSEHRKQRGDVVDVVITHEAMLQRGIGTASMMRWVDRVRSDRTALISTLFASSEYATRVG